MPVEEPTGIEQQLQLWDNSIIIDPIVRPCINAIINHVKNIESGLIAKMIYIMSGQIPQFNWTITEVPQLPSPNTNADARTVYGLVGVHHSTTELNQAKLTNATNISLARTLLHEAIHAFIYDYIFNNDQLPQIVKTQILSLPFAEKLKEFFKIKYNRSTQGNAFHNLMMKKFHDDIRDALKLVCPLLGITITGDDLNLFCSDMAWGGLNEDQSSTSVWMDPDTGLTDEVRARITKRLDIELNNLGSFAGYYGGYYFNIPQVGTKACP